MIHPLFDKARRQAADPALPDGPFRGVPFLVKDAVCHTAGDPYHLGMRFLKERGWVAETDTELARRFRAAGLVFVGKTNTPELAMSATTEPLAYGATRKPLGPGPLAGRVERGLGRRRGGGARAAGARQRHGRLDPHPGQFLRAGRAQAHASPFHARAPTSASTGGR